MLTKRDIPSHVGHVCSYDASILNGASQADAFLQIRSRAFRSTRLQTNRSRIISLMLSLYYLSLHT